MTRLGLRTAMVSAFVCSAAWAQTGQKAFPDGVFTAKTIAIVNDTKQPGVEKGADEALAQWGQFKVVDDPQLADVVLRFDKAGHHEGRDTQKTDSAGKPAEYGYEMSFSSTIQMKAYYKDADAPFYATKTDDGKQKAGSTCINAFHTAWRDAAGKKP
jgi:hypothetical protein